MSLTARRRRVRLVNRLWLIAGALLWPLRLVAAIGVALSAEFHRQAQE